MIWTTFILFEKKKKDKKTKQKKSADETWNWGPGLVVYHSWRDVVGQIPAMRTV